MKTQDTHHFHIAMALSLITAVIAIAISATARPPQDRTQVAAVFAPWVSPEEAMSRVVAAGARPVREGLASFVMIAELGSGDAEALRQQGAWLILDPVVTGDCVTTQNKNAQT